MKSLSCSFLRSMRPDHIQYTNPSSGRSIILEKQGHVIHLQLLQASSSVLHNHTLSRENQQQWREGYMSSRTLCPSFLPLLHPILLPRVQQVRTEKKTKPQRKPDVSKVSESRRLAPGRCPPTPYTNGHKENEQKRKEREKFKHPWQLLYFEGLSGVNMWRLL